MRNLLRDMLESGYNKHARPRHSLTESKTFVKMGISLESIVDVVSILKCKLNQDLHNNNL